MIFQGAFKLSMTRQDSYHLPSHKHSQLHPLLAPKQIRGTQPVSKRLIFFFSSFLYWLGIQASSPSSTVISTQRKSEGKSNKPQILFLNRQNTSGYGSDSTADPNHPRLSASQLWIRDLTLEHFCTKSRSAHRSQREKTALQPQQLSISALSPKYLWLACSFQHNPSTLRVKCPEFN